jgi:hypothetical protein
MSTSIRAFDATAASLGPLPEQTTSTTPPVIIPDVQSPSLIIKNLPNQLVDARLAKSWNTSSVRSFDPTITNYGPFPPTQEINLTIPVYRPVNNDLPDALNLDLGSIWSATRPYVTFHSSGFNNFYDAQIASTGGTNIDGQGNLKYIAKSHTFVGDVLIQNADAPGEAVSFGQMQEAVTLLNTSLANEQDRVKLILDELLLNIQNTNFEMHREVITLNRTSSQTGNEKYYGTTTYNIHGTPASLVINFPAGDDVEYMGLYSISDNKFEITSPEIVHQYTASITYLRKS